MHSGRAIRAAVAALLLALVAACSPSTISGQGRRAPCPAVFFGVAGSGQGPAFPAPATVPRGVSRRDARGYGSVIAQLKTTLQRIAGHRLAYAHWVPYPAVTAPNWATLAGLTGLAASEAAGTRHLLRQIHRSYRDGCGARSVLLAGYSQGAEVVTAAVDRLPARRQRSVTVALLGNPSFEPDVRGDVPHGATGSGVRPTFLGGTALTLPGSVRRRTIDICAPGDPVCGVAHEVGGTLGEIAYVLQHLPRHTTGYGTAVTARAARFLWQHRVPMP